MEIKPIYEFLIWENCNNKCKFCPQRDNAYISSQYQQICALEDVIKFIQSNDFIEGSHVLLVGGEIFCYSNKLLNNTYRQIIDYMKANVIDLLYINTNLLYSFDYSLNPILHLIESEGLIGRVKFTTSFDIYGRFERRYDTKIFLDNLNKLNHFDSLNVVINTILTKQCIHSLINNNCDAFLQYLNKPHRWINFIPYIGSDEEFLPTRNDVFHALMYIDNYCQNKFNKSYLTDYIHNFDLKQDKLVYKYIPLERKFELRKSKTAECGHSVNFRDCYSEHTCFICDIKEIFNDCL